MKIIRIIYTDTLDKNIIKNRIIRESIKVGMQYIEMEDEIIIDCEYLFRFIMKEDVYFNPEIVLSTLDDKLYLKDIAFDESEFPIVSKSDFHSFTKKDYKKESKRVNDIIKTKQYYNRRRYR